MNKRKIDEIEIDNLVNCINKKCKLKNENCSNELKYSKIYHDEDKYEEYYIENFYDDDNKDDENYQEYYDKKNKIVYYIKLN